MGDPLVWSITTVTGTEVAVEVASAEVLAANTARMYASFVNNSNQDMFLGFGAAAVMNAGIMITAEGGSFEINRNNLFRGAVYAIATGGAKSMCVSEGV